MILPSAPTSLTLLLFPATVLVDVATVLVFVVVVVVFVATLVFLETSAFGLSKLLI